MKFQIMNLVLFLILYNNLKETICAKILVINWVGTKSSKTAFEPLFKELAARGHQLTIISSFKPSKPTPNIREIVGQPVEKTISSLPNPFEQKLNKKSYHPFTLIPQMTILCRSFMDLPEIKEIMNEQFDLITMNAYLNECAFGLLHHFNNVPFIYLSSMPLPAWVSVFGAPSVPSYNPFILMGYSHEMNFYERIINFVGHVGIYFYRNYYFNYYMEKVYHEYFPNAPGVQEIEKNVSLILMNTHISYNYPRPLLPDMIQVGGMHCRPAKPLPEDLQKFLDDSGPDGFIYFSMGSFIQSSVMPDNIRKELIKSFGKLKQRVLWKWETETMDDLPPNMKLGKWLPQQDILGHPKIKLFITHGGLLSTQESTYFGVPLIGIPMFGDQDVNMEMSQRNGFALTLQLEEISEERLTYLIQRILTEPRFRESAQNLSRRFQDDPDKPLDRAVFWTEYVLRHKGAPHLRSPARDLSFLQYYSLDVIFTFAAVLFSISYMIYYFVKKILSRIFRSSGVKLNIKKKTGSKNDSKKKVH